MSKNLSILSTLQIVLLKRHKSIFARSTVWMGIDAHTCVRLFVPRRQLLFDCGVGGGSCKAWNTPPGLDVTVEFWPRSHQDGLSDSASGGWKAVERGQSGQSEQRVASNSGHTTQSQGQQLECRVHSVIQLASSPSPHQHQLQQHGLSAGSLCQDFTSSENDFSSSAKTSNCCDPILCSGAYRVCQIYHNTFLLIKSLLNKCICSMIIPFILNHTYFNQRDPKTVSLNLLLTA